MTELQKKLILKMRKEGYGYKSIASAAGVSRDAVRLFCKKRNMAGYGSAFELNVKEKTDEYNRCLNCFSQIKQYTKGRPRKFCSCSCRREWWRLHPELIKKEETAKYHFVCVYCNSEFISYGNKNRKYCSHNCYIHDRFYREENDI